MTDDNDDPGVHAFSLHLKGQLTVAGSDASTTGDDVHAVSARELTRTVGARELTARELTARELTARELTDTVVDGLGWGGLRQDVPDHRDQVYGEEAHAGAADTMTEEPDHSAALSIDLRNRLLAGAAQPKAERTPLAVPPYDQGPIEACASNAIAAAIRYLILAKAPHASFRPSRMFLYWNETHGKGSSGDAGVSMHHALKAFNRHGVCDESIWRYVEPLVDVRPSAVAYDRARFTGTVVYKRLLRHGESHRELAGKIRRCLSDGLPVLFGLSLYDNLRAVPPDGRVSEPARNARLLGGHAGLVVACAPHGDSSIFTCQNSWGEGWGDKGFFELPATYIDNPAYAFSFWVIESLE